jgi:hypothetical protein
MVEGAAACAKEHPCAAYEHALIPHRIFEILRQAPPFLSLPAPLPPISVLAKPADPLPFEESNWTRAI